MSDQDQESLEWEEVEVTDSIPVDESAGLSLEDEDEPEWEDEEAAEQDDPYSAGESEEGAGLALDDRSDSDSIRITPLSILEAILFVGTPSNEPLNAADIAALMRGVRPDEIDDLVAELNEDYLEQESALEIVSESGGYRLALREAYHSVRTKFYGRIKEARLSQAAIDVLAIVAYRQPVTRDDVDRLRSRPSGGLLNQLVRRKLVQIEISEGRPKKKSFRTTPRFLELFGMSDLTELPQSQDD